MHLQMAMKLHRLGKDPRVYLDFLTRTSDSLGRRIARDPYIIYEPRIVANEILFRFQYWVLLSRKYIENASSVKCIPTHGPGYFRICGHLSLVDDPPQKMFTCLCNHLATGTRFCLLCTDLMQCNRCGTEFQMQTKDYGEKGVAFVLTKWVDFGAALSPYDKKLTLYTEHTYYHGIRSANGNIMSRFESCKPSEFTPVLSRGQEAEFFKVNIQAR